LQADLEDYRKLLEDLEDCRKVQEASGVLKQSQLFFRHRQKLL
jgi:hypothetical protein